MDEMFQQLRAAVIEGMPDRAAELAQQALATGADPLETLNQGCIPGMELVGQKFGCQEMFLPDVLAASQAMKSAVAVLEPEMRRRGTERKVLGKVVLGTVRGDIHEIGKSLVAIMLSA